MKFRSLVWFRDKISCNWLSDFRRISCHIWNISRRPEHGGSVSLRNVGKRQTTRRHIPEAHTTCTHTDLKTSYLLCISFLYPCHLKPIIWQVQHGYSPDIYLFCKPTVHFHQYFEMRRFIIILLMNNNTTDVNCGGGANAHQYVSYLRIVFFWLLSWNWGERKGKRGMYYCNASTVHLLLFFTTNKCTIIYHNSISLCNVYSYMFRHFYVIIREFYNCTFCAFLSKAQM